MAALEKFASLCRLHIIAIAFFGTLTFGWLFTGLRPWTLAFVTAFDWFIVNLLNRVVDEKEDRANQITATDFATRHQRLIRNLSFVLLAVSFLVSAVTAPWILPYRGLYHFLGLAYNYPLLPGGGRIKTLFVTKNVASATGFLLTCFAYPLAAHVHVGGQLPPGITKLTIVCALLFFLAFELSYEVLYDLRDRVGDALAQVRTIPVLLGEAKTKNVIDALLISSALVLVLGYAAGVVPWRLAIMGVAPVIQFVYYKRILRVRELTAQDCIALTWIGAALLTTYHAWIALGLPGVGA